MRVEALGVKTPQYHFTTVVPTRCFVSPPPFTIHHDAQTAKAKSTGLLLLLGWLATHNIRYVFSALLLLCPLPLFFTLSAELKEFYDARRLHFANIHLFFIFEYLFIFFFLFLFFLIIQRSQQKFFGKTVIVDDR